MELYSSNNKKKYNIFSKEIFSYISANKVKKKMIKIYLDKMELPNSNNSGNENPPKNSYSFSKESFLIL